MKLNTELVFAEMGDGFVAVPVGESARHIVIRFNKTGAEICKAITEGLSKEAIASKLISEYEIDEETALNAVENVLLKLKEEGLLSE